MALSLQRGKPRPIGLQRQQFPYGHLHASYGGDSSLQCPKAEMAEADIYAPPQSDSDDKSPSPPPNPTLKSESPPPPKRRRFETRSSQQADPTTSASGKKERDPADIPKSVFTPSNPLPNRAGGSTKIRAHSSASNSQAAVKEQDDEPFPGFPTSQSKPTIKYHRNIHKAPPAKSEKKEETIKQEQTESMITCESNGFKIPDVEKMCALVPLPEKGHTKDEFKQPIGLAPSPRSARASRRSTQEESNGLRPALLKTFKKPPQRPSSPKRESPPPRQFKIPKGVSTSSDSRRSNRLTGSSQDASMPDAPIAQGLAKLQGLAKQVVDQAKIKLEFQEPESSATASSGPTFNFDVGDSDSSSSLSSAPEIEELDALDFQDGVLKANPMSSPQSQCRLCKEYVSRLFLEEFSSSANLNIRQQAAFCKAHKVQSAKDSWREKGYPNIEWNQLQARLQSYREDLVGILNGTRRSYYRNVLDDHIKSGKRTAKQLMMVGEGDVEGSKMGYYGTKGQRILMDYLMDRFASRIRRLAGTDRLISAAGVAGFVQGVLVPELAVMLVKDDMHVDEEQARVILKESSEIGNLLNEEEDEVIKDEPQEGL